MDLISVGVIYKCVVDINNAFFQIYVTPAQARYFTHTESASYHNRKNRIPMGIGVIALQEIKEKVLLRFRKSTPFLGFKAMRLFQSLQLA